MQETHPHSPHLSLLPRAVEKKGARSHMKSTEWEKRSIFSLEALPETKGKVQEVQKLLQLWKINRFAAFGPGISTHHILSGNAFPLTLPLFPPFQCSDRHCSSDGSHLKLSSTSFVSTLLYGWYGCKVEITRFYVLNDYHPCFTRNMDESISGGPPLKSGKDGPAFNRLDV